MLWFLVQLVFNIILGLGVLVLWLRLKRPSKDDPRLSRGLQLLQSKISVLEDLSDRTDKQVDQLCRLIESKTSQVQKKMLEANQLLQKIDMSMEKSLQVADIFQDKIPHEEILERKNTAKYVQAARLAHQGLSAEDIAEQVDLPISEIEFIAKVNKKELMFDEEKLPKWLIKQMDEKAIADELVHDLGSEASALDLSAPTTESYESLKELGDRFRAACKDFDDKNEKRERTIESLEAIPEQLGHQVKNIAEKVRDEATETLKKVSFPKIYR